MTPKRRKTTNVESRDPSVFDWPRLPRSKTAKVRPVQPTNAELAGLPLAAQSTIAGSDEHHEPSSATGLNAVDSIVDGPRATALEPSSTATNHTATQQRFLDRAIDVGRDPVSSLQSPFSVASQDPPGNNHHSSDSTGLRSSSLVRGEEHGLMQSSANKRAQTLSGPAFSQQSDPHGTQMGKLKSVKRSRTADVESEAGHKSSGRVQSSPKPSVSTDPDQSSRVRHSQACLEKTTDDLMHGDVPGSNGNYKIAQPIFDVQSEPSISHSSNLRPIVASDITKGTRTRTRTRTPTRGDSPPNQESSHDGSANSQRKRTRTKDKVPADSSIGPLSDEIEVGLPIERYVPRPSRSRSKRDSQLAPSLDEGLDGEERRRSGPSATVNADNDGPPLEEDHDRPKPHSLDVSPTTNDYEKVEAKRRSQEAVDPRSHDELQEVVPTLAQETSNAQSQGLVDVNVNARVPKKVRKTKSKVSKRKRYKTTPHLPSQMPAAFVDDSDDEEGLEPAEMAGAGKVSSPQDNAMTTARDRSKQFESGRVVEEPPIRGRGRQRSKITTERTDASANTDQVRDTHVEETNAVSNPQSEGGHPLQNLDPNSRMDSQQSEKDDPVSKPPANSSNDTQAGAEQTPSPQKQLQLAGAPPRGSPSGALPHSPINKGKVPYRVGLSKRARIAPLLKILKK